MLVMVTCMIEMVVIHYSNLISTQVMSSLVSPIYLICMLLIESTGTAPPRD